MPFFVIQLCWGTSDCHCGSTVRDMGVAGITTHFKTSGVLSRAVLSVSLITFHCESTSKQSTCSNDFRMVSNKGIPNASANSWISGASDTIPILSLPNLQHQSISCIHSFIHALNSILPCHQLFSHLLQATGQSFSLVLDRGRSWCTCWIESQPPRPKSWIKLPRRVVSMPNSSISWPEQPRMHSSWTQGTWSVDPRGVWL